MLDERLLNRWPNKSRKLPYGKHPNGYGTSEDKYVLVPIEEEVLLWEQAFDYLDQGSSLREATEWISQKLKKTLVHQTMANMYRKHRKPFLRVKTSKLTRPKPSKETKEILSAVRSLQHAQRRVREAKVKKIPKEHFEVPPEPKERKPLGSVSPPPVPKEVSYIFQPNPGPQSLFLASSEEEVLYGGAAGGEPKSWFFASFYRKVPK